MERLVLSHIKGHEDWGNSVYVFNKPYQLEALNELWSETFLESFPYWEKGSLKDIHNRIDWFKNESFDIHLIFTQDKIIFIVRGKKKDLLNFKEIVFKYSDMKG